MASIWRQSRPIVEQDWLGHINQSDEPEISVAGIQKGALELGCHFNILVISYIEMPLASRTDPYSLIYVHIGR